MMTAFTHVSAWARNLHPKLILRYVVNNRDYAGTIAAAYAVLATQVLLQIVLLPLYVSALGKLRFGVLMVLLSAVFLGSAGLVMLQGRFVRALSERISAGGWAAAAPVHSVIRVTLGAYGIVVGAFIAIGGLVFPGRMFGAEFAHLPDDVALAVGLAALYPLVLSELSAENVGLIASRRQSRAQLFLVLSNVLFASFVVPSLLLGGGLPAIFGSFLFAVFIARTSAWVYRRSRVGGSAPLPSPRAFLSRVSELFDRVGLQYALAGILIALLQADTLVVGFIGGASMAAEFVLVWKVAEILVLMLWRISDSLQPELMGMQLRGEFERLARVYRSGIRIVRSLSFAAGAGYAFLGGWMVRLWVGADVVPDNPLAYALAGGAVMWLGSARFPAMFVYALARLPGLVKVLAADLTAKWTVALISLPFFDYSALLAAINIVHLCGIAFAYPAIARAVLRSSLRPGGAAR